MLSGSGSVLIAAKRSAEDGVPKMTSAGAEASGGVDTRDADTGSGRGEAGKSAVDAAPSGAAMRASEGASAVVGACALPPHIINTTPRNDARFITHLVGWRTTLVKCSSQSRRVDVGMPNYLL